jgi:TPR repeat protein
MFINITGSFIMNSKQIIYLANAYRDGINQIRNIDKAISLYETAIEMGDSDAMVILGDMYFVSKGVVYNSTKAFEYYMKAYEKNNINAMARLSIMYYEGSSSVSPNLTKSVELMEKVISIHRESAHHIYFLATLYKSLAENSNDQQRQIYITRSDALYKNALDLFEKEIDNMDAVYQAAYMYSSALGVSTVDYKKALDLYKRAMEMGCVRSMTRIAEMYKYGIGVTKDEESLTQLCEKVIKSYINCTDRTNIDTKNLAEAYEALNSRECMKLYAEVIERDNNVFARDGFSRVCKKFNESELFIKYYLQYYPNDYNPNLCIDVNVYNIKWHPKLHKWLALRNRWIVDKIILTLLLISKYRNISKNYWIKYLSCGITMIIIAKFCELEKVNNN